MKYRARTTVILCMAILIIPGALSARAGEEIDIEKVVREIDQLYRSNSSYSELEMEIVTPHWQRTMAMDAWSIGMHKTFIRITSPPKDEGIATLRIENEMWNYLPKTNKVIKIPPSMMMSSWMGSDFTNDDLVKEFSLFEDYSYEMIRPEGAVDSLLYVNCIPREDLPVVWGNVVIAATKGDHIPVWQKYYDEERKLMRIMYYRDMTTFRGRTIPATLELVPQNKEGHKTVIRYKKIEFDAKVEDGIFSLRNLRSSP